MFIEFMILFKFASTPNGSLNHVCLLQVFDELG